MTNSLQGENLIFLISQPRAGSTLLQRLLSGDERVHTTAEPWILLHPLYALRSEGHTAEYNADLAYTATEEFCQALPGGQEQYFEALRQMACHLYNTACQQTGKSIFLDKTPRYYHILPELAHLFPEARFILLLRNPLAVLASILNQLVKEHYILLGRYRHDLITAPQLLAQGASLLGSQVAVVHYETLVTEPEATLRSLCDHLGLQFSPAMLEYGQRAAPRGQMGDPSNIHKRTRATTESLDRWLELGKDRQARHFAESYLDELGAELVAGLGYDATDLKRRLEQVPVTGGKVTTRWKDLFQPDERTQKRLALIELALLEHSRLVHASKKLIKSRRRKGAPPANRD